MALVVAVVIVALISSSSIVRRAIPSESLVAMTVSLIAVVALFEMDRLG